MGELTLNELASGGNESSSLRLQVSPCLWNAPCLIIRVIAAARARRYLMEVTACERAHGCRAIQHATNFADGFRGVMAARPASCVTRL